MGKISQIADRLPAGRDGWSYKSWYQLHKEELLEEKKRKYRTDPKYRRDAKDRSKKRYLEMRKKKPRVDRKLIEAPNGMTFMTIGKLAALIKLSEDTIRRYHKKGIIPDPSHFDVRGWRLYTGREVAVIQAAFRALEKGDLEDLRTVAAYLRRKWRQL